MAVASATRARVRPRERISTSRACMPWMWILTLGPVHRSENWKNRFEGISSGRPLSWARIPGRVESDVKHHRLQHEPSYRADAFRRRALCLRATQTGALEAWSFDFCPVPANGGLVGSSDFTASNTGLQSVPQPSALTVNVDRPQYRASKTEHLFPALRAIQKQKAGQQPAVDRRPQPRRIRPLHRRPEHAAPSQKRHFESP